MIYYGFGVFPPCTVNTHVLNAFRDLAYVRRMGWTYYFLGQMKKGMPLEKVVDDYIRMRGLGTEDRNELVAEFAELNGMREEEVKETHSYWEQRERIKMSVLFGMRR